MRARPGLATGLLEARAGQTAALQPLINLMRQRHGVSGNDEAADGLLLTMLASRQCLADFFREEGWPEALDGGQGAEVFALLRPSGFVLRHLGPEGIGLLAIGLL